MMHLSNERHQSAVNHASKAHVEGASSYPPIMTPYDIQDLQIQSSFAEAPSSEMPIRALEVCTTRFLCRMYVPATTAFIGNEWKTMFEGKILYEDRVMMDGVQAVACGECGAFKGCENTGEAL